MELKGVGPVPPKTAALDLLEQLELFKIKAFLLLCEDSVGSRGWKQQVYGPELGDYVCNK